MAERKVLNKYYPPDFDPSKLRIYEKKTARRMCNVRMMLPMSVRCYTCGNYMYIGTKFNMKVETLSDEDYLGIKIYRFYFKCTRCYAMITFKTDPKNHDYISETGASRNHEPWKDMLMAEEEYKEMKKNEMKEDAMKSLEHRTYDSKREMDILDALDQVKNLNRRQVIINHDELIEKAVKENEEDPEKDEIDKEAKEKFNKNKIKKIEDYNLDLVKDKQDKIDSSLLNNKTLTMLGNKNRRNEILNKNFCLSDSDSDENSDKNEENSKIGSLSLSRFNLKVRKAEFNNPQHKTKDILQNQNNSSEKAEKSIPDLKNKVNGNSNNIDRQIKRPLSIFKKI